MSREELKAYLAEIVELERKRYEVSLAIAKLRKKRNIYEYMAYGKNEKKFIPKKWNGDAWKDRVEAFILSGYSCIMVVFTRNRIRILDREISQLIEKYKKTDYLLQEMYKDDIIYPKYQKQFPVSRFYEYVSSGRCTRLEGYGGAYNLYENELLAKQVLQCKNCRGSDS